ncbi:MAG: M28 family peptidase [Actinomycetota bacterium]|nr:M28 family peptidase [Actinomycetota bacterium]
MHAKLLARRAALATALTAAAALGATAPANADHPQPARDIAQLPYQPIGHFAHGDDIPEPSQAVGYFTPLMSGKRFNPSGTYNAYDTNVFETLMLPFRAAGDDTDDDPYGNGMTIGDPRHGYCEQDPEYPDKRPGNVLLLAGVCPNHALEYADYYEETMQDILGKFGVTLKRYPITVPPPALGSVPPDNTLGGEAYNLAAVVPGSDHPDEHIVIGAHYDQTNDGPASTWDSAEGHAQIIRVAKQMADYWTATGTRPSATVKFIPWAGEEAGTLGSLDYAEENIVPGEEGKVRGYWNTDPCAGGYPAYRYGNPEDRVPVGIQLARPTEVPDEFADLRPRVTAFNEKAEQVVEDFFNKVDDTVPVNPAGTREVFISKAEDEANTDIGSDTGIKIGDSRPELFSSDWRNFLGKGIPFFNPGPEVTGPSDEGEANWPDGAATFHTPRDNQVTMNQYTGQALSQGNDARASEAWAKGMEMCASLLSWGMLREDQGGAQTTDEEVVAYYEALPNEAIARAPVTFDASGSYQYDDKDARTYVPEDQFEYTWEFGDGSTGTGKTVEHTYAVAGRYTSKLTVRNKTTNQTDTMTVPITVVGASLTGPVLTAPGEDEDGNFDVTWEFDEAAREGLRRYLVEEATDVRRAFADPAETIDAWTSSEPTTPEITPWKVSEDSDSPRGRERHGGEHSFYSGVPRTEHQSGVGPNSGVSKLTLKQSFQIAKDAELSFWSSFANDLNDIGLVEVAIDDGSPDEELDWVVLHREGTANFYHVPNDEAGYPTVFDQRRIDLGAFAGQKIKLRFVYQLGPAQYVNVARAGWYVDDIQVETGTFSEVGETTAKSLSIGPRRKGTYAYRVRAIYADTATLPSNYGITNVPVGTDPPGGPGPNPPGTNPPGTDGPTCSVSTGFRSLRVTPRGRGLRFAFTRGLSGPVNVHVYRYRNGKRITRRAVARFRGRTRSFTWNGRGRRVRDGSYYVRVWMPTESGRDNRYVALRRKQGRFKVKRTFIRRPTCGPLRRFHLGRMVFGGKRRQALRVTYTVAEAGTVRIQLLRGRRVVRRTRVRSVQPGTHSTMLSARRLRRGEYRVRLVATLGGKRVVSTLGARRI